MRILPISFALCLSATTSFAVDDCLVGTWQADLDGLAAIMSRQMNGTATPVRGRVQMAIAGAGRVDMTVDDLTLNVVVPNVPPMDVFVSGVSGGTFTGEGGAWAVETATYNLVGSADVMGQRMDIPFTSATGMFGGGSGSYTCSSNEVIFTSDTPNERIPPRWTR